MKKPLAPHSNFLRTAGCIVATAIFCFSQSSAFADTQPTALTLKQAEAIALKKNPKIAAADLQALVSKQILRQARSAYYPVINGDVTAVGTPNERNNILSAGTLQVSSIYDRQADGVSASQLITDFGRTMNVVATSKYRARAQEQNALATRAQILLAVDTAYFSTLQAQSVLEVARQTVSTRQYVFDQVQELAKNNLKSDLDTTFAEVDLESSKLLLANAENDLNAAFNSLSTLLGEREKVTYNLHDETLPAQSVTNDWELVETALKNRPELAQLRFERDAASSFASAEKGLNYPTVNAFAAAGILPIHNPNLVDNYAAAGVNLRLPIFEGFLFSARRQEAQLKADVAVENVRDAELAVIRDVRLAAMNQDYAAKRLTLTSKLLASSNKAFDLAQERYQVGTSSIIELSQAQLNQTEAKIQQTKAAFELQVRAAVLNYQLGTIGQMP